MSHQKNWADCAEATLPNKERKKRRRPEENRERFYFPLIGIGMPMLFTLVTGSGSMMLGAGLIMAVVLMALFSTEQQG